MSLKLPNAFCLGAQKSGTTTLSDILKEHPQIYIPKIKEPHFYDKDFSNGLKWYEEKYYKNINDTIKSIIDFTPIYLYRSDVAKKIYDSQKNNLKFFVILRNPAKRSFSHYLMSYRKGHENLTFDEAIKHESTRIVDDYTNRKYSYISRGYYYSQIQEYLKYFNLDQFYFIIFEEFVKNPEKEIKKLLKFLNVSSDVKLNYTKKSNEKYYIKSIKYAKFLQYTAKIFDSINFKPKLLRNFKNILLNFNKSKMEEEIPSPNFKEINNQFYLNEIEKLSELLDKNLISIWEIE